MRILKLSSEQVAAFEQQGFVGVAQAFEPREVETIERWCREIAEAPQEVGRHWVYHEKSQLDPEREIICRIENIVPFHRGFAELVRGLSAPAAQLLGEEAVLFKEKINFKMPGADGFAPHQDSQAGWESYADFFVTVVLCVDESTVENGCLRIAAGHHRRGLFRTWEPLTDEDMRGMEFELHPMKPGDAIFIDSYTPHRSDPNLSDLTRRLYFATYNRRSAGEHRARYLADKHKNYPPDIERRPGVEYVFRV